MLTTVIGLLTFVSVTLLAWELLRPKENPVLRRIGVEAPPEPTRERQLKGSLLRRLVAPAAADLGRRLAGILPPGLVRRVDRVLTEANLDVPAGTFIGFWALSALLGIAVGFYFSSARLPMPPGAKVVVAVYAAGLFVFGPYILVRRRAARRKKQITRDLPFALDLLVTCVEAGVGVEAAFAVVTEKTSGPISETFAQYLKEVGLGRPRREALMDVARRTGVPDLIRFATSVEQAEEMGVSLGDVLRKQAEDMRVMRRLRAQEAANRAPFLITIPLVFCFLPAMAAVIVVPTLLNLLGFIGKLGTGVPFP
jgi:tight adherence protein C